MPDTSKVESKREMGFIDRSISLNTELRDVKTLTQHPPKRSISTKTPLHTNPY
jgi:hypothetical protein